MTYTALEQIAPVRVAEGRQAAEARRLLMEARQGQRRGKPYRRAAVTLGSLLIRVGTWLHRRYEPHPAGSAPLAVPVVQRGAVEPRFAPAG